MTINDWGERRGDWARSSAAISVQRGGRGGGEVWMAGCHVAWKEGEGFGKWPCCSAEQTDKINAKVNKDIVVPEKERARDLSLLARSLAVICPSLLS